MGMVVMEEEFWIARASFLSPIPDVAIAADLLALAADSLLAGNEAQARSYVEAANMATLRAYTRSIASQTTREIHRFRDFPDLPVAVPMAARGPRQPPPTMALDIFRRDGFRCRYCGCRIVFPGAQSVISALLPDAVEWGLRDVELNAAFYTLKGVLDHVVPHAHGGTSRPENIVASCQPCNYGKGTYFIQQLGLSDPRLRPPNVDDWDGLLRVLPLRPIRNKTATEAGQLRPKANSPTRVSGQPSKPKGFASIDEFASSFSVANRQHLSSLLQVVEASADIGVFWTLRQVLMVKIRGLDVTIEALGIETDTTVQIPWRIGPYKQEFRSFAETLAAALPGGTVYETEKMWRVRCFGRVPNISDVMQDPTALRDAFKALYYALNGQAVSHQ